MRATVSKLLRPNCTWSNSTPADRKLPGHLEKTRGNGANFKEYPACRHPNHLHFMELSRTHGFRADQPHFGDPLKKAERAW